MPTWAANTSTWTLDICNSDKNYKKKKMRRRKNKLPKLTHGGCDSVACHKILSVLYYRPLVVILSQHILFYKWKKISLLYDCKAFTVVIKVFLIHFWSWSCVWKHSRLVLSLLSIWWHLWPEVKGRLVYVRPGLWPWPLQSIQLRPRKFQADTSKGVLLWPVCCISSGK